MRASPSAPTAPLSFSPPPPPSDPIGSSRSTDDARDDDGEDGNGRADPRGSIELSVVMPCLNEALTIAICVKRAVETLRAHGIRGEVIVADNGSTDGSQKIA